MTTNLVNKAMTKDYDMGQPERGLVFRSDRSSQYTSKRFRKLLVSYGVHSSTASVGAY